MYRETPRLLLLFTVLSNPTFAAMTLTSADLAPGAAIASTHIYTRCGGRNISPQLSWSGAPSATKSFALTMIDLDVKPSLWSHWIVVDLPVKAAALSQGARTLPGDAKAIMSNFGDAAYAGPCPPKGSGVHHYEFTIWALPTATISLPPDDRATDLMALLARRALDKASFTALVQAPPG
jgi:Raf kinase inhibitor-like YbhB/YbcL family protein